MQLKKNSILKQIKIHAETSIGDEVVVIPQEEEEVQPPVTPEQVYQEEIEHDAAYEVDEDEINSQMELEESLDDTEKPTPDESVELQEPEMDESETGTNEYGLEAVESGVEVKKNVPYISENDVDDGQSFGGGVIKGTTTEYDGDDDNSPDSMRKVDPRQTVQSLKKDNTKKVNNGYNLYGFYIIKNNTHVAVDILVPSIDLAKSMIDGDNFIQVSESNGQMVSYENKIVGGTPGISHGDQELMVYKNNEWIKV